MTGNSELAVHMKRMPSSVRSCAWGAAVGMKGSDLGRARAGWCPSLAPAALGVNATRHRHLASCFADPRLAGRAYHDRDADGQAHGLSGKPATEGSVDSTSSRYL